jgi:hypothetical protein
MLSDPLSKSEQKDFVEEPEATTDKLHYNKLNSLHEICDAGIALHSVETAIQVLVCCYLTFEFRTQLLRLLSENILAISHVKDIRAARGGVIIYVLKIEIDSN